MTNFGWSYPPGAANDPSAPYNQDPNPPCPECGEPLGDVPMDAVNVEEEDNGARIGDLACGHCGAVVEENVLLREPEFV